jgi:hypothetical protein
VPPTPMHGNFEYRDSIGLKAGADIPRIARSTGVLQTLGSCTASRRAHRSFSFSSGLTRTRTWPRRLGQHGCNSVNQTALHHRASDDYERGSRTLEVIEREGVDDRDLAHMFVRDHFNAAGALTALQMRRLPEEVRARVAEAISNETGYIGLRARLDTSQTELVLVPSDGSEPLWLTRGDDKDRPFDGAIAQAKQRLRCNVRKALTLEMPAPGLTTK